MKKKHTAAPQFNLQQAHVVIQRAETMQCAANLRRLGKTEEVERIFRRGDAGTDELEELRIDGSASVKIGEFVPMFLAAQYSSLNLEG
jgi:hypothetical protein